MRLALVLVIAAVSIVILGSSLFLGEWLLGSMGWGVLHGFLAFLAVAMVCIFLAVGVSAAGSSAPWRSARPSGSSSAPSSS